MWKHRGLIVAICRLSDYVMLLLENHKHGKDFYGDLYLMYIEELGHENDFQHQKMPASFAVFILSFAEVIQFYLK